MWGIIGFLVVTLGGCISRLLYDGRSCVSLVLGLTIVPCLLEHSVWRPYAWCYLRLNHGGCGEVSRMCGLPEIIPSRQGIIPWQVALPVVDSAARRNGCVFATSGCSGFPRVVHSVSVAGCGGERGELPATCGHDDGVSSIL